MSASIVSVLLALSVVVKYGSTVPTPEVDYKISPYNNAFAIKLYQELIKPNENLVCSPLSLSIVLSMLLEGATDNSETFTELQTGLQYKSFDLAAIEDEYKKLLKALDSKDTYTLSLADSIWIKDTFKVMEEYKQKVIEVFKAEANSLSATNGAEQINMWVANHTMNKITKLFDTLDPSVVMVLVNAIYFQASWAKSFQKEQNEIDAKFKSNDDANSASTVTLMKQTSRFPYLDDPSLKARVLVLDYVGNEMCLVVLLPRDGSSLKDLEESLTSDMVDQAVDGAMSVRVDVALPKYTVESSLDLNDPIQNLGINKIFSSDAELGKISNTDNIAVSKVVQKAIIEVSENGTVAAAATGALISLTSIQIEADPVVFRADHPFIYVLYHKTTNAIIFIGRYTNAAS